MRRQEEGARRMAEVAADAMADLDRELEPVMHSLERQGR